MSISTIAIVGLIIVLVIAIFAGFQSAQGLYSINISKHPNKYPPEKLKQAIVRVVDDGGERALLSNLSILIVSVLSLIGCLIGFIALL